MLPHWPEISHHITLGHVMLFQVTGRLGPSWLGSFTMGSSSSSYLLSSVSSSVSLLSDSMRFRMLDGLRDVTTTSSVICTLQMKRGAVSSFNPETWLILKTF